MGIRGSLSRTWAGLLATQDRAVATLNSRVDRRISLALGSALIIFGIGQVTGPVHVRVAFYGTVAQIIPVLMLVTAVEGRYFRERGGEPPPDRLIRRGFWYAGLVGIGASLAVIARGTDSVLLRGAVIYSLALIAVLITIYAIYGPAVDAELEGPEEDGG